MGLRVEINKSVIRKLQRELQREPNRNPVSIPIQGDPSLPLQASSTVVNNYAGLVVHVQGDKAEVAWGGTAVNNVRTTEHVTSGYHAPGPADARRCSPAMNN